MTAALFNQDAVYAVEPKAKPADPSVVTRTDYKVSGGAYGATSITGINSDNKYNDPKDIPGYKYIGSEPDNGGRVWVHYYVKDSASTTGSSSNTGNNTGSNANTSTGSNIDKDEYKWLTVNGKLQLYINNNLATGWQEVDGKSIILMTKES